MNFFGLFRKRKSPQYLELLEQKRFQDALPEIKQKVREGDPAATGFYGMMFHMGRGVKKDTQEAFCWLLRASNLGHPKSQLALALIYRTGDGIPTNLKEAAHWFFKAAHNGVAEAVIQLIELLEFHPDLIGSAVTKSEYDEIVDRWRDHLSQVK